MYKRYINSIIIIINGEGGWVKEFEFEPLHGYPTLHKSTAIIGPTLLHWRKY